MTVGFAFAMAPRVGLEVSPALVTFSELLLLPYSAMQAVIEDELEDNPALERLDDGECPVCGDTGRYRCPVCSRSAGAERGSGEHRFPEDVEPVEHESDAEALLRAARMDTRTDAEAEIVEYLVDSLDDRGFLDRSCAELAAELDVDEAAVASALDVVRRHGPPGIGATSVPDCLLLQIEALGLGDDRWQLARAVVAGHLPALARGRFTSIVSAPERWVPTPR
jgi:RNA polymerase sigma-54 factor